jgi:hypothetical protein
MTDTRLTLRQAAAVLGVSESAIRKRVERGTLRSDKGPDGRRYVYLDSVTDNVADEGVDASATPERDALISELRAHNDTLREQLEAERHAHAEARRLLAAALERIPALEPPHEPVATTETPPERAEQKPQKEESSPPQGQDTSDSALREGAQRGILVAPRPRWAQIGVAVLLAGMITTIPQLIWWLATGLGVFPSPQFVYWILFPLTLLCGLWAGLAWPGRHPKGLAVLGSLAGLLDLVINWSIAVIMRNWWPDVWYITPLDFFLGSIPIAVLFTAGGLFGDLIESWRSPRRREEESEVVRGIAQHASGPGRQPSETTLKLVQALGPSILALLGVIVGVITQTNP